MSKPKKLTKAEIQANAEKFAAVYRIHEERCQALKAEKVANGQLYFSYPHFPEIQSTRFLPNQISEFRIVKSGKIYRPYGTSIPHIRRDGYEYICAIQMRNGRDYGPMKNIRINNTDLVE